MIKTLQRVILLAILMGLAAGAFWPWEGKDEKASKKSRKNKTKEQIEQDGLEGADTADSAPITGSVAGSKAKTSATKNAEKIKARRKFQQTPPDQLKKEDVRSIFESDLYEETIGAEDAEGVTDKEITKIWNEHMHDFIPEDMVHFIVPFQNHMVLFETIGHFTPKKIKGAYYVKGT